MNASHSRPRLRGFTTGLTLCLWASSPLAKGDWIATNVGNGADAEVRDHQPTTNFGASTEIAMRVSDSFPLGHASDGTDRFSLIYTRFDLAGQAIPSPISAAFRLTIRNTNLTANRLHDSVTPNLSHRAGIAVYGLSPSAAAWNEATITYHTAPGITSDGDTGTKDMVSTSFTFLGTACFPPLGVQNHLPVGSSVVFSSPRLDDFITSALAGGATQVTLVTTLIHSGEEPMNDLRNFNYLFTSKEMTTLNADASYDADITDPANPLGSPHSAASNAAGTYSPALRLDPLPLPGLSVLGVEEDRVDFQIDATADGFPFVIQRSRGLAVWVPIASGSGTGAPSVWSDQRVAGETRTFYRLSR